ncbi:RcnB family protein [Azospirillum sp. B21]|nr:RcnB family protein [Azospirillum sp. B21]
MDSMKKTLLAMAAAVLVVTAATGTPAFARGWQPGPDNRHSAQHQGHERGQNQGWGERDQGRRTESHGPVTTHRFGPPDGRGWQAGQRLPQEWRAPRHVIAKPAAHHLHRPPPGQRWVRVGPDAVLVASTTGIIVKIMPGLFR